MKRMLYGNAINNGAENTIDTAQSALVLHGKL